MQGKDHVMNKFVEERKENRAALGAQVMNGGVRQLSASKKKPTTGVAAAPLVGRNTTAGWAKGQLPVAMQPTGGQTSNQQYGREALVRQGSTNQTRQQAGQAFGIPSSSY